MQYFQPTSNHPRRWMENIIPIPKWSNSHNVRHKSRIETSIIHSSKRQFFQEVGYSPGIYCQSFVCANGYEVLDHYPVLPPLSALTHSRILISTKVVRAGISWCQNPSKFPNNRRSEILPTRFFGLIRPGLLDKCEVGSHSGPDPQLWGNFSSIRTRHHPYLGIVSCWFGTLILMPSEGCVLWIMLGVYQVSLWLYCQPVQVSLQCPLGHTSSTWYSLIEDTDLPRQYSAGFIFLLEHYQYWNVTSSCGIQNLQFFRHHAILPHQILWRSRSHGLVPTVVFCVYSMHPYVG